LVRYVPESRDEEISKELDFVGAVLITLGLSGITYGSIEIGRVGADVGFQDPLLLGSLLLGLLLVVGFVIWEARTDHPMMPLFLFRSRTFTGANLLTFFLYGALGAALFFLPLNLIQVQGYGETLAGLALLPFSILLMFLSPWAGRLVDRIGPRIPLTVGPAIVAISFVGLSLPHITNGPQDYWTTFFPPALLLGLGMGVTVAPLTSSVMGAVPQHNSGIASGINNAMSRASQVVSTAVMGGVALLLFTSALTGNLAALSLPQEAEMTMLQQAEDLAETPIPENLDEQQSSDAQRAIDLAFVATFRAIMLIAAGMCALSALLALVIIEKELEQPETLRTDEEGTTSGA
jgi:MFS family permease